MARFTAAFFYPSEFHLLACNVNGDNKLLVNMHNCQLCLESCVTVSSWVSILKRECAWCFSIPCMDVFTVCALHQYSCWFWTTDGFAPNLFCSWFLWAIFLVDFELNYSGSTNLAEYYHLDDPWSRYFHSHLYNFEESFWNFTLKTWTTVSSVALTCGEAYVNPIFHELLKPASCGWFS